MTCKVYSFEHYRRKSKYNDKKLYCLLFERFVFIVFASIWYFNMTLSFAEFRYSHNLTTENVIRNVTKLFEKKTITTLSCDKFPLSGKTHECIES